jgi:hypothetical protein
MDFSLCFIFYYISVMGEKLQFISTALGDSTSFKITI